MWVYPALFAVKENKITFVILSFPLQPVYYVTGGLVPVQYNWPAPVYQVRSRILVFIF